MTAPDFITAPVVAALIGYGTVQTFRNHLDRLVFQEGFPAPLPTSQRPLKWRRSAVLAWLEESETRSAEAAQRGTVVPMRRVRA